MTEDSATTWDLSGRVALITGASRGIGEACAEAMVEAGARVIAVARSEKELASLADRRGRAVEIWVEDGKDRSFRERLERVDRLDILFNNAGTNAPQPFVDIAEDVLD